MERRILASVIGFIGLIIFGWPGNVVLGKFCTGSLQPECLMMSGVTIIAIVAGFLILEILMIRRMKRTKAKMQDMHHQGEEASSVNWLVIRPIAQVILISVLAGLSIIIQGAFVLTVCGIGFGFFLAGLLRAITDRLPPTQ